jgi:hypothetical protein
MNDMAHTTRAVAAARPVRVKLSEFMASTPLCYVYPSRATGLLRVSYTYVGM